jgi:hypothetical protein
LIAGFGIRWIKETVFADPEAIAEPRPFQGRAELDNQIILVRGDVLTERLPYIVAPEIFHLWFSLNHGLLKGEDEIGAWEAAADNFGWKVSAALFEERR